MMVATLPEAELSTGGARSDQKESRRQQIICLRHADVVSSVSCSASHQRTTLVPARKIDVIPQEHARSSVCLAFPPIGTNLSKWTSIARQIAEVLQSSQQVATARQQIPRIKNRSTRLTLDFERCELHEAEEY